MILLLNFIIKLTGWLPWLIVSKPKVHYQNKEIQGRRIKGKGIIVSNHKSIWDFANILFLFPFRCIRCVTAEVMFSKNAFLSFLLRSLGCIRVERDIHDFAFVSKCERVLQSGGVVEIYPESRLPRKGEIPPLEFKPSFVYIALATGADIIPVYTEGNYFNNKRNNVIIGTPINAQSLYDEELSEKENINKISLYVRGKIIELREQIQKQEKASSKSGL